MCNSQLSKKCQFENWKFEDSKKDVSILKLIKFSKIKLLIKIKYIYKFKKILELLLK